MLCDFNSNFEKDTDRCQGKLKYLLAHFDLFVVLYIISIVICEVLLGVTIIIFRTVG